MKHFGFVALCAILALVASANAIDSHDLMVGGRVHGDYLIEQKTVEKGSFPLRKVKEIVTVPGDGVSRITSVEIFDLKPNGNSATPTILKGGPGETFVTIRFKSERGHGIHFLVKVYGHKFG